MRVVSPRPFVRSQSQCPGPQRTTRIPSVRRCLFALWLKLWDSASPREVAIPRRSLYFMTGPSRFQWQHGIKKARVLDRGGDKGTSCSVSDPILAQGLLGCAVLEGIHFWESTETLPCQSTRLTHMGSTSSCLPLALHGV